MSVHDKLCCIPLKVDCGAKINSPTNKQIFQPFYELVIRKICERKSMAKAHQPLIIKSIILHSGQL